MKNTKIEWATHTFNPWMGCTKVSPGCTNCYAETLMDSRFGRVKWGKGQSRIRTRNWNDPVRWSREAEKELKEIVASSDPFQKFERPRVFCASLADWLDEEVPIEWFCDLLELIFETPMLDWLLLTKRPENWASRMGKAIDHARMVRRIKSYDNTEWKRWKDSGDSPKNVWIGVSAEDQKTFDVRTDHLAMIPSRVQFASLEPLLGPINMAGVDIDWVIVGGESGKGSRPMAEQWVLDLHIQCKKYDIPFFFKQWGGEKKIENGRELAEKIWSELPRTGLQS